LSRPFGRLRIRGVNAARHVWFGPGHATNAGRKGRVLQSLALTSRCGSIVPSDFAGRKFNEPITDPSWQNAPPLVRIAASQQGGTGGAQIWGITEQYTLITNFQETPGGTWSGWSPMGSGPVQAGVQEIAAAQQNDGRVELWATDNDEQLWTMWQTTPGGYWSGWAGPNWNGAPILTVIAAAQQGGARGAQLWGITDEDVLITCFQQTPGGGWSPWVPGGFLDAPLAVAVTAAQQNNGCVQIWMLDQDQ
jgi:hypothetical protein